MRQSSPTSASQAGGLDDQADQVDAAERAPVGRRSAAARAARSWAARRKLGVEAVLGRLERAAVELGVSPATISRARSSWVSMRASISPAACGRSRRRGRRGARPGPRARSMPPSAPTSSSSASRTSSRSSGLTRTITRSRSTRRRSAPRTTSTTRSGCTVERGRERPCRRAQRQLDGLRARASVGVGLQALARLLAAAARQRAGADRPASRRARACDPGRVAGVDALGVARLADRSAVRPRVRRRSPAAPAARRRRRPATGAASSCSKAKRRPRPLRRRASSSSPPRARS